MRRETESKAETRGEGETVTGRCPDVRAGTEHAITNSFPSRPGGPVQTCPIEILRPPAISSKPMECIGLNVPTVTRQQRVPQARTGRGSPRSSSACAYRDISNHHEITRWVATVQSNPSTSASRYTPSAPLYINRSLTPISPHHHLAVFPIPWMIG